MTLRLNIIGAGHLGQSIAYLLFRRGLVTVGAVCNQSRQSAQLAVDFIGAGQVCVGMDALPPADLTLISTPDGCIADICTGLASHSRLKPGSIVWHCSGSLGSDELMIAREEGCSVASIHPMKSFARPDLSVLNFTDTYCALEGDYEAKEVLRPLFEAIGAIVYEISKEKKSLYHAAGVFASNYLVTLSEQALSCLQESGVEHALAMRIITSLMQGTVSNLATTLSPEQSLTGPVQRGDTSTLSRHRAALSGTEKEALYSALGVATLPLSSVAKEKKAEMREALTL
ncbi:Rossmann-like and DUF2520 domain-containing protein [Legionella sp. CNM-4043-24]|uniref:Rossmann-like and DUF2520 domain-containing protein n=1 Tax=Legionella sp. CNM-4043-24 TaxID=3421646 RepID=UPI00403AAE2C